MIFEILRVGDQASLVSDLKDIDVRQLLGIAAFIFKVDIWVFPKIMVPQNGW